MGTYLYGLLLDRNAHLVPPHITGLAGAALRVVPCDRIGALASTVAAKPRSASIDDVRAHDHALQAVVHHGATVASVRFGQTFSGDEELKRHVATLEPRVRDLLERRDGCVEMRLLMTLDAAPEPAPVEGAAAGAGTAYLEQLRAARGGESYRGIALRDTIGPVVLGERVEPLARGRGAAFSHLIRREDESVYRETVERQPTLSGATLVGPLAFYSFADADDE